MPKFRIKLKIKAIRAANGKVVTSDDIDRMVYLARWKLREKEKRVAIRRKIADAHLDDPGYRALIVEKMKKRFAHDFSLWDAKDDVEKYCRSLETEKDIDDSIKFSAKGLDFFLEVTPDNSGYKYGVSSEGKVLYENTRGG